MMVTGLILLIAALHFYILWLEMFRWQAPRTLASFGMTAEQASATRVLAANQGRYNGFLAAGLVWSGLVWVAMAGADGGHWLRLFFLACVLVAGIYGGLTATIRILFIQALPAAVALALVLFG